MSEYHGTFKDKSGNILYPKVKMEDVVDLDLTQVGDTDDMDFEQSLEDALEGASE